MIVAKKLNSPFVAKIEQLLENVRDKKVSPGVAAQKLAHIPFEDLGFARIDHHRTLRIGVPEAILSSGKKLEDVVKVLLRMKKTGTVALATRVPHDWAKTLKRKLPAGRWHPDAGIFALYPPAYRPPKGTPRLVVASAGTADQPVAEEAAVTAEAHAVAVERLYDVGVAGLHRLLASAESIRRAEVIIAVAGMDGALPSVIGGLVAAPVVAVPTSVGYGANFGGVAALLTMLNSCAPGVVVVNIDNGYGAAIAACKMLRARP
jgi:NCAIR mutase (PurE)-related protein